VRADRAFTARALSTFGLDRLYRVYISGNQFVFIKIGGQAGVAVGISSQFGLVGSLLFAWWQKQSRQKLQQRIGADDGLNLRDLLARDRSNFLLDPGQIVWATIEPPSRIGAHGPHHGMWKFEESNGKKRTLQFEELSEMREAMAVLPALLGPSLTIKAEWNEKKGRYTKPGAPG
jgi:hypothetical protein